LVISAVARGLPVPDGRPLDAPQFRGSGGEHEFRSRQPKRGEIWNWLL